MESTKRRPPSRRSDRLYVKDKNDSDPSMVNPVRDDPSAPNPMHDKVGGRVHGTAAVSDVHHPAEVSSSSHQHAKDADRQPPSSGPEVSQMKSDAAGPKSCRAERAAARASSISSKTQEIASNLGGSRQTQTTTA